MRKHGQHLMFCVQCHELLPRKCHKCITHPDRKPRIVEVFGVPPILQTAPCRCVLIACQREGCDKTMWRQLMASGELKLRNHFCSVTCRNRVIADARKKVNKPIPCTFCNTIVLRSPSDTKNRLHTYCNPECFHRHRVQVKANRRRQLEGHESIQALACYSSRCRGEVVDHRRVKSGVLSCVRCNARRDDRVVIGV